MSQTTVASGQSQVFAGVLGDNSPNYVRSYVNEEASLSLAFGDAVVQGTDDGDALKMVAGGLIAGVIVHSHRYAKDNELDSVGLTPNTTMALLRKGTIWVVPEDDVSPGDPVRVRHTATGNERFGAFMTAADGTDTGIIGNAEWLTSASGGSPALLEIDLTGEPVLVSD